MIHLEFSSGDLNADRRAHYARLYAESGDFAAAADVQAQALELAPRWAAGFYELGNYLEKAGRPAEAAKAWRDALELAPADIFGAGLKLSLTGQAEMPPAPPSEYVEALFDEYADRFDKALLETLEYRVPELLSGLLNEVAGGAPKYARVIDLGCGTGLFGERVRQVSSWLEGYDLSQGMLTVAAGKGVYDHLGQADIGIGIETGPLAPTAQADLVAAADVFAYFGDLSPVIGVAAGLLRPGGLLAFTCEAGPDEVDWLLQPSLRYCHGAHYLRKLLETAGLGIERFERETIRRDKGEPIHGYLVIAAKQPAGSATLAPSAGQAAPKDVPCELSGVADMTAALRLN
jgi:predicted TPR repeat methyltransferase